MTYLLDTNAVSDIMGEHPRFLARFAAMLSGDHALICPIVRGEILHGIERLPVGKRRAVIAEKARRAFHALSCEPLDEAVGDDYALLRSECESKGVTVHENDVWIAAVALHIGAVVITRDKDFGSMRGVAVEDWTS